MKCYPVQLSPPTHQGSQLPATSTLRTASFSSRSCLPALYFPIAGSSSQPSFLVEQQDSCKCFPLMERWSLSVRPLPFPFQP